MEARERLELGYEGGLVRVLLVVEEVEDGVVEWSWEGWAEGDDGRHCERVRPSGRAEETQICVVLSQLLRQSQLAVR